MSDRPETMHRGEMPAFSVEARISGRAVDVCGQVFDWEWRTVEFTESPTGVGVPRGPSFISPLLGMCGLYSYSAAESLRWWLHAHVEHNSGHMIETRIVKHIVKYSVEATVICPGKEITAQDFVSAVDQFGHTKGKTQ